MNIFRTALSVTLLTLVCILTGCNNDEGHQLQQELEEHYSQDFKAFRDNQLALISNRTRSGTDLSEAQFQKLVCELDANTKNFVSTHEETLKPFMPASLSIDTIEIISFDEEAILSYLSDSFSESFADEFIQVLNNQDIESTISNGLNPYESLLIVNAEIYTALADICIGQYKVKNEEEVSSEDNCLVKYNQQIHKCNLAQGFIQVIGIGTIAAAAIFTEGMSLTVSAALETFFSAEALAVNIACQLKAQDDYEKCLKENQKRK